MLSRVIAKNVGDVFLRRSVDLLENNVPFDNTTLIYLINLLRKLGWIRVRLRVALF